MDEIDQASFRPVTVGRKGGAALMRRQSQMTKTIEAKKDLLFNKQAGDYSTWLLFHFLKKIFFSSKKYFKFNSF